MKPEAVAVLGLVHVVGGDEHGDAAVGQAPDQLPERAPRDRVDARGRLVEEHELRRVHERAGERQALALAAGQLAGQRVLAPDQVRELDHPVDALARGAAPGTP